MLLRIELFFGLALLIIYFCAHVYRRSTLLAALTTAYVLFGGLIVAWNPPLVNALIDLRMRTVAAKSFCLVAMLTFFMTFLDRKHIPALVVAFEVLAVVNTVLLLSLGWGLFNAGSMDFAFIAMIYPISLFRPKTMSLPWRWVLIGVPPLALFAQRPGSTGFLVLLAGLGSYFLLTKSKTWLLSLPLVLVAGLYFNDWDLLQNHSARTDQWLLFLRWTYENSFYWFGTGLGTFQVLGPAIQNKVSDLFVWMHSEPLQVLFEQGLVGLTLITALTIECLRRSAQTPWLFATSIATIACSVTQFPIRYFVGQLFVILLIRLSLLGEAHEQT